MADFDSSGGFFGGWAQGQLTRQQLQMNQLRMQELALQPQLTQEQIQSAPVERELHKAQTNKLTQEFQAMQRQLALDTKEAADIAARGGISFMNEDGTPRTAGDVFRDYADTSFKEGNVAAGVDALNKSSMADSRTWSAEAHKAQIQKNNLANFKQILDRVTAIDVTDEASWKVMEQTVTKMYPDAKPVFENFDRKLKEQMFQTGVEPNYEQAWKEVKRMGMTSYQRANEALREETERRHKLNEDRTYELRKSEANSRNARRAALTDAQKRRASAAQKAPSTGLERDVRASITESDPTLKGDALDAATSDLSGIVQFMQMDKDNAGRSQTELIHEAISHAVRDGSLGPKSYSGGGKVPDSALSLPQDENGDVKNDIKSYIPGRFYQSDGGVRRFTGNPDHPWIPPIGEDAIDPSEWDDYIDEHLEEEEFTQ